MTCQELRFHFENLKRIAVTPPVDSAELAAHTTICPGCGRFVEEQQELGSALHAIRESVPEIPTTLDAAVLANYREFAAEKVSSVPLRPVPRTKPARRINMIVAFAWTAAIMAAMLIAVDELRLFFPSEEVSMAPSRPALPHLQPTKSAPPPSTEAHRPNTGGLAAIGKANRKPRPAQDVAERKSSNIVPTTSSDPLASGFRTLMYCDALSCGDPMEMIRVQLPTSTVGPAPAGEQTNGMVYADVLVGPDGIARGIRIVQ